jgi:hypothetical protein
MERTEAIRELGRPQDEECGGFVRIHRCFDETRAGFVN